MKKNLLLQYEILFFRILFAFVCCFGLFFFVYSCATSTYFLIKNSYNVYVKMVSLFSSFHPNPAIFNYSLPYQVLPDVAPYDHYFSFGFMKTLVKGATYAYLDNYFTNLLLPYITPLIPTFNMSTVAPGPGSFDLPFTFFLCYKSFTEGLVIRLILVGCKGVLLSYIYPQDMINVVEIISKLNECYGELINNCLNCKNLIHHFFLLVNEGSMALGLSLDNLNSINTIIVSLNSKLSELNLTIETLMKNSLTRSIYSPYLNIDFLYQFNELFILIHNSAENLTNIITNNTAVGDSYDSSNSCVINQKDHLLLQNDEIIKLINININLTLELIETLTTNHINNIGSVINKLTLNLNDYNSITESSNDYKYIQSVITLIESSCDFSLFTTKLCLLGNNLWQHYSFYFLKNFMFFGLLSVLTSIGYIYIYKYIPLFLYRNKVF